MVAVLEPWRAAAAPLMLLIKYWKAAIKINFTRIIHQPRHRLRLINNEAVFVLLKMWSALGKGTRVKAKHMGQPRRLNLMTILKKKMETSIFNFLLQN